MNALSLTENNYFDSGGFFLEKKSLDENPAVLEAYLYKIQIYTGIKISF